MSILGKVLIIFNLLAATVFVYVASVDWAARYKWAYAVFRDDLALKGLPLDAREENHLENVPLVEKLSDNTLRQVFGSFGEPVRTQMEEVERVQRKVMAELAAITSEDAKRARWKELLTPLANNFAERDEISRRADPKTGGSWSDLERELNDLFAEVLKPETDDEGKMTGQPTTQRPILIQTLPRDKHRAVAHLLYNVVPKEEGSEQDADARVLGPQVKAHLRLQIVIGLNAFTEEAKHQAYVFQTMSDQVRLMTVGDRSAFEIDYQASLDEIRDRAETIASRDVDLATQRKLKDDHTKLRDDREKDVAKAKEDLGAGRKKTFAALQQQAREEDRLFKDQRFLGSAKEDNELLERRIRALEKVGVRK